MASAWILVLLVLQGGHSYILLTGNLDDVHTIAKQMAASPVVSQLNRILRRASYIFNQQLRTGNYDNNRRSLRSQLQTTDLSYEPHQENHIENRNRQDQLHRRHRHGGTDDDPHHSYRDFKESHHDTKSYNTRDQYRRNHESQESIDKSRPEEQEPRDKEKDKAQGEDKKYNQRSHERTGELKDRRKERQAEERDDHNMHEKQNDNGKIVRPEKRDESELDARNLPDEVVTLGKNEIDARNLPDEVLTLGKNASFYFNSIKKIMETV